MVLKGNCFEMIETNCPCFDSFVFNLLGCEAMDINVFNLFNNFAMYEICEQNVGFYL